MSTTQPDARLERSAYSLYPLPIGAPFCRYQDLAHGGDPNQMPYMQGLNLPVPTEQQWLELYQLAPLAERAGYWVTLTQLGPGEPLRLTTTPKGYQPHEQGLQWCDTAPYQAYHRARHYLNGKLERAGRGGEGQRPAADRPLAA